MGRKKLATNVSGRIHSIYLDVEAEMLLRRIQQEQKAKGVYRKGWLNDYVSRHLKNDFFSDVGFGVLKDLLLFAQEKAAMDNKMNEEAVARAAARMAEHKAKRGVRNAE